MTPWGEVARAIGHWPMGLDYAEGRYPDKVFRGKNSRGRSQGTRLPL